MPRINFPALPDPTNFDPAPAGKYVCILTDVEELHTNAGDDMWKLEFMIEDGPYKGKRIWDNMVFSENKTAQSRVKLICSRLGYDMTKETDLTPSSMKGRRVIINTEVEEYQSKGQTRKKNAVPFDGYEMFAGTKPDKEIGTEQDEIPF